MKNYLVKRKDPILREKSKDLKDFSKLDEIIKKMYLSIGLGLGISAVQVGHLKNIFLLRYPKKNKEYFVNPKIVEKVGYRISREGCLSLPGEEYLKIRSSMITVEYYDLDKDLHCDTFIGNKASVIQHEIDHLNGIMLDNKNYLKSLKK